MNILVTGAAGFIGSNFCNINTLKYPNDNFIGVDALTYAANIKYIENIMNHQNFYFRVADIRFKSEIESIFKEFDIEIVINFAAESHVDNSIRDANIFLETNVIGTNVLLDLSTKYSVKRFHQVSTDEVYGELPLNSINAKFTEKSEIKPSSPYSASKAAADMLVTAYSKTHGLPISISRCSNNYGPNQNDEKLIPVIIKKAKKNEFIPIYGDGKNVRDWIHVEDHCHAIDLIVRKGHNGEIYNIGGDFELNNLALTDLILKVLNKPFSLVHFVEDRKGHDSKYAIDFSKIHNDLGWMPRKRIDKEIEKIVDYY